MNNKPNRKIVDADKGTALMAYFGGVNQTYQISPEEEKRLAQLAALGEEPARDRLVIANLRLVINIAKKYVGRGLDLIDLIQEGNIGLLRAVQSFNWQLNYHFSTYATWWIRQTIIRSIEEKAYAIRLPTYAHAELQQIYQAHYKWFEQQERDPSTAEISAITGIAENRIKELYRATAKHFSLDVHFHQEEEDTPLMDYIQDRGYHLEGDMLEKLNEQEKRQNILRILQKVLSSREYHVLRLRFGLNGCKKHTLVETGRTLGITCERVRQIEKHAISKIRNSQCIQKFVFSLDHEDVDYEAALKQEKFLT